MSIKDANKDISEGTYDICIIGSGPVGLTIASELMDLAKSGKRICVLESGGKSKTPEADLLREVENDGDIVIKENSRERVFGGASTTWSGLSAPLDEIDMINRPYLLYPSSWPIGISELNQYYDRAGKYGFPDFRFYTDNLLDKVKRSGDLVISPKLLAEKIFVATDPPWNFANKLKHIFYHPNIDLFLNATVTKLISGKNDDGSTEVTGVKVINADKKASIILAKIFVVAVGGIETSRLLFLSNDTCQDGLGNEHDQVGRFIMNHPKNNFGSLRIKRPIRNLPYFFGHYKSGISGYAGFRIEEKLQIEKGILNSYLRFEPVFPWTENDAVPTFVSLVKRAKNFINWWKRRQNKVVGLLDWSETGDDKSNLNKGNIVSDIYKIVRHFPSVFSYVVRRLSNRGPMVTAIKLRNFMEMEPQANNRITLSKTVDRNGTPISKVTLNLSDLDKKSVIELHKVFAEEIFRANIGIVESNLEKVDKWPINVDASHHLGGARMGIDPKYSVVDTDLKVHSVKNLYICGGAVFPTSGCANSTYTMIALAIRLADKLKKDFDTKSNIIVTNYSQKDSKNILVIGAGKRVQSDVLPAIKATGKFKISGVYAQNLRRIHVGSQEYEVEALNNLNENVLNQLDYIYVAVPSPQVSRVFEFLSGFNTKNTTLIIDTPVFPWKYRKNKNYFKNFTQVVAAEDIVNLPWINPIKELLGGEISELTFNQSTYRYHGVALIKAIMGKSKINKARLKKSKGKEIAEFEVLVGEKTAKIKIIEPRDYSKGTFTISGPKGSITDDLNNSNINLKIRPIISGGLCVGLDIVGKRIEFTSTQSELIGLVPEDSTITSLTLELKRIGLAILLSNLADGRPARDIKEALADARLDEMVHRFGVWFNAARLL